MDKPQQLFFTTRQELQQWFITHHSTAPPFDMLFYKKHTKRPCIAYNDAVEEALCFGWIDGMIRRIDDEKYIRHFSRRNPKSSWSPANAGRMKKMIKAGKAAEHAIRLFRQAQKRGLVQTAGEKPAALIVPDSIMEKLKEDAAAMQFFAQLNSREKEAYIRFITEAKRAATRQKRLAEMITKLRAGWRLPYFRPAAG